MKTEVKGKFLMNHRKEQLSQLIRAYYHDGVGHVGIPTAIPSSKSVYGHF